MHLTRYASLEGCRDPGHVWEVLKGYCSSQYIDFTVICRARQAHLQIKRTYLQSTFQVLLAVLPTSPLPDLPSLLQTFQITDRCRVNQTYMTGACLCASLSAQVGCPLRFKVSLWLQMVFFYGARSGVKHWSNSHFRYTMFQVRPSSFLFQC